MADDKILKDKVVWGGLYKVNHNRWNDSSIRNDQIYYQAVPAMDKDGNVWMQDTHQLKYGSLKDGSATLGAMERIFNLKDPDKGHWAIYTSRGDWYHTGNEKITSESMLNDYELICDLHDYRPLKKNEDYRDYDPQDVLHGIHLYQEHGYSWDYGDIGVTLIKKLASPVLYRKFVSAMSDTKASCKWPSFFSVKFNEMVDLHKELIDSGIRIHPKDQVKYENTIWLTKRLKEMRQEIQTYLEDHKYVYKYDYEDFDLTLKQIHPDMINYLENKCYCPHEIYDSNGIWYQLFYPDTVCKIVQSNEYRSAVVAKASKDSDPQIIIFWHDDESTPESIIEARRMDVTETNLLIAKQIVKGDNQTVHSDKYTGDEFPEDINELINSI